MKKVLLLIGFFIGLTSLQAQIVNEGILKIEPGTTVYFGNDYTNKAGAIHTNDGDLHVKGNFTNNGDIGNTTAPTAGHTYFDSTTNDTQTLNGTQPSHFYNLTVNNTTTNAKGLAVADAYHLEVENNLHLTNGKLRLMGGAQLVQNKSGVSGNTGDKHLVLDQQGAKNATRYNYWSSPVQNDSGTEYKLGTVLKDGTTPDQWFPTQVGFTAGLNGNQNNPIEISTRWLWKYINGDTDPWNDTGWLQLFNMGTTTENANSNIKPGEGFCMKGTQVVATYEATPQNYSFEGKPNDGIYTLAMNHNKEYLVGNPYPSALDANQFINDNIDSDNGGANPTIDGTLYYWHHWSTNTHLYTSYGAGYATYNLSGANYATKHFHFTYGPNLPPSQRIIPARYIPIAQGFVVRSNCTNCGGNIIFNNGQRAFMLEGGNSVPVKSKNTTAVTARIRLEYVGPDERSRPLLLAFTDNSASDNFDLGYDGEMIDLDKNDMYFTISGEEASPPYCIQGVGPYNIDAEYPLIVKMTSPGRHIIMIDVLENFDEPIYILDKYGTHNLRESDYIIFTEVRQTQRDLKLVFKPQTTSHVQDYLNDFVTAFYTQEKIIIHNNEDVRLTGMQVYNTLGQLVYQIDEASRLADDIIHIPFAGYAQSAYIIKLQAEMGNGTYKFINY